MSYTLRTILIAMLVVVLGAALFYGGIVYANARFSAWGPGMMGGVGPGGMMSGSGYSNPNNGDSGTGMMGGGGMMGGYGGLSQAKPISVQDARTAVESYLEALGNDDLAIKEVMIFDNGAYAIVEEESTGVGAFELLVDPLSLSVFPEYGPNMMWNLKYGMMNGSGGPGMMGGGGIMMGGWYGNNVQIPDVSAEMPVSPKEAGQSAQEYLDAYLSGAKVSDEINPFYGYYTIDLERDGKIVGMLGVNGYTKQVFLHTWHGKFVEASEE